MNYGSMIIFDELGCNGNESSLFQCPPTPDCTHQEDIGLTCQNNGESKSWWAVCFFLV